MTQGLADEAGEFISAIDRGLGGAAYSNFDGFGDAAAILIGYQDGDSAGTTFGNISIAAFPIGRIKFGNVFSTNAAARSVVKGLSFQPVKNAPFNSHGQQVIKKGNQYITHDVDGHSGGAFKLFDRRGNRLGTYNEDLSVRISD